MGSWFDDNRAALEAANIPESAARDFIARNPGDYSRISSALGPDYARREESSSPRSGGDGQSSGDGMDDPRLWAVPRPYQPFTEQFVAPTARELPTWTRGDFSFNPAAIRDNPAYQVRLSDTIKASDRSAAAKGLSFTNQAREDLVRRAGDLASDEIGNEFGRQFSTYGQARGQFEGDRGFVQGQNESDRGFARATYLDRAGIHNLNETGRYGSERSNLRDSREWDSDLWGRDRMTRLDDRAWDSELWGRGRADRLDTRAWDQTQYGRGLDTWNQTRTDRNDTWGRGIDLWNQNRTDRNDRTSEYVSLSDLILRGGLPPDWWTKR